MEIVSQALVWLVQNAQFVAGFILPPFIQLINSDIKSGKVKFLVTFVSCLVISVWLNWSKLSGFSFDSVESVLAMGTFLFAQSEIVYRLYFKGSALQTKIVQSLKPDKIDQEVVIPSRIPQ